MVYTRLTGEGPYFDSRVVYVSETGPKGNRTKRLAIMDQDGANHRFLTNGQSIVLTPRVAPNQQSIVYKIGRASCRDRVCQYVSISVVAVSLNKKESTDSTNTCLYINLNQLAHTTTYYTTIIS